MTTWLCTVRDRVVRHQLGPRAYIRYGDFAPTRRQAHAFRRAGTEFLADTLRLGTNPKNDVVCRSQDGLKFLGHAITPDFWVVDRHTTKAIMQKVHRGNIASYRSLALAADVRKRLDWIILDEIIDITGTN